jgi:hypothetical protein
MDRLLNNVKRDKRKSAADFGDERNAVLYFGRPDCEWIRASDYILNTIFKNYNDNASIVISTHLIAVSKCIG